MRKISNLKKPKSNKIRKLTSPLGVGGAGESWILESCMLLCFETLRCDKFQNIGTSSSRPCIFAIQLHAACVATAQEGGWLSAGDIMHGNKCHMLVDRTHIIPAHVEVFVGARARTCVCAYAYAYAYATMHMHSRTQVDVSVCV